MTATPKEILVIGYGAVGSIYSLVLKRSGMSRVTVVARGNYQITKDEGMTFKSQKYGDITGWRPDRLCASLAEAVDQAYSHVLVTTKVIVEAETTAEILSPLLKPPYSKKYPQPTYILLQNGINIELDLYRALKQLDPLVEPRIINSSVYVGSRLTAKNVVEHSYFDRLDIGIYRPTPNILTNTPEETTILTSIGDILKAGGTTVNIVPEIQRVKFEKNIWNAGPRSRHSNLGTLIPIDIPASRNHAREP
ncbi:hypothetical protein QCA50_006628 [Cerrena zonata]|uniref:Ketopantoate reductase N-terminal domain-containing protein n=1 Tax=Cerrena zonata TaxID=2478898 RepID=A0AAW0GKC2_9APHY